MIKKIDVKTCKNILSKNYIGRLGYIANRAPYVSPITYYYDSENNYIISYAAEGHKINAMRNYPSVSFQVDEVTSLNHWKSVLLHGLFEELQQIDAKYQLHEFAEGVKKVIWEREKEDPKFIGDFSSKLKGDGSPVVYRIKILGISGKQRED